MSHGSKGYLRWRVLTPDDTVMVESGQLGSFVSEGRSSSTWTPEGELPDGTVVEVTEEVGYRHV